MRRWLTARPQAASHVADRPTLWIPGALAWIVTVGWLALFLGVAQPPTRRGADLLRSAVFTSGRGRGTASPSSPPALLLVGLAIALASVAEAVLLRGRRATRRRRAGDLRHRRGLRRSRCSSRPWPSSRRCSAVAPAEFNAPDPEGGPLLRTLLAARAAPRRRWSWPRCSARPSTRPRSGRWRTRRPVVGAGGRAARLGRAGRRRGRPGAGAVRRPHRLPGPRGDPAAGPVGADRRPGWREGFGLAASCCW